MEKLKIVNHGFVVTEDSLYQTAENMTGLTGWELDDILEEGTKTVYTLSRRTTDDNKFY